MQRQIDQQAADTLIVRRAQLLATIYEEVCGGGEAGEGLGGPASGSVELQSSATCRPRAHERAREEAVRAFVEIERGRSHVVNLRFADLSGLSLDGLEAPGALLSGADLSQARLGGADLSAAVLVGTDLSSSHLVSADLSGSQLFGSRLSGAKLNSANLARASLLHADLSGAVLNMADLSGAYLISADLSDSILIRANLSRADLGWSTNVQVLDQALPKSRLFGSGFEIKHSAADLSGADLSGADLSDTEVTQEQLESARGNIKTLIPEWMNRPIYWVADSGQHADAAAPVQ